MNDSATTAAAPGPLFGWFPLLVVPVNVRVAACLAAGIALGAVLPIRPAGFLVMALLWAIVAAILTRRRSESTATFSVLVMFLVLGVCRWQIEQPYPGHTQLSDLCQKSPARTIVRLRAIVSSVPVIREASVTVFERQDGQPPQTRFQASILSLVTPTNEVRLTGECRVYVSGDATQSVSSGDEVLITGQLDWPKSVGNPGEFDFRSYLIQQRIAGLIYVRHPASVRVIRAARWWNVRRWISFLRQDARRVIVGSVHPDVQGVALALLLGNRYQLPSETEAAFTASGTMHLLAISGLHVGILCIFLLRTMNVLLVSRRRAMLMTAGICVIYAMMTDLRPSVVRATVFFVVFVAAEFSGRRVHVSGLLSVTAIIMLLVQPELVFNTGAWLSFLSVAALGWFARQSPPDLFKRDAPLDADSLPARLAKIGTGIRDGLRFRSRQMLFVLAVTTPLVARTFHVVSPVGLVVNLLLIPAMAGTLCMGFVTLFAGLLLPVAAGVPGALFSWLLMCLTGAVDRAADIPGGHVYIADLPWWCVPAYYVSILTVLMLQPSVFRTVAVCAAMMSIGAGFVFPHSPQSVGELHVTVLDVGHGSAAVVEVGERVLLLDAGALNRGERAADAICRFLWYRGQRRLHAVVLSHADMDHYNALPGLLDRFPIAEIVTTRDFVTSPSPAVQAVIELAGRHRIPVRVAADGDSCEVAGAHIQLRQADVSKLSSDADDNEKSLVVSLRYGGRHVVVPGDIEGGGLEQLLPKLGRVDLLVSPHHGSKASNTSQLATALQPQQVFVSARTSAGRPHLENVFAAAQAVHFTSDVGAIHAIVRDDGRVRVTTFRPANDTLSAQVRPFTE
ncbi:MAG: DNA internalization-related competence protein ComEC/Rec2 [Planctomycetaceae bacterium]